MARTIFNNSKLPEKFMIMATLLKIPKQYRNDTHKIIDLRNDIVHDGKTPPENIKSEFSGFLQAFALILSHQSLRFPMAHSGNRLLTQEDWEQLGG